MSFSRLSSKGGDVGHILPGFVWLSLPDASDGREKCQGEAARLAAKAARVAEIDGFAVSADMILRGLPQPWGGSQASFSESPPAGTSQQPVVVLYPEVMTELDCCKWSGSGHYDMSIYHKMIPPHIGQIVSFNRIVQRLAPPSANPRGKPFVVLVSTNARKAFVSVLAGSSMIYLGGDDADTSWAEILKVLPSPSSTVAEAWDRFPPTFSMQGLRCATSLRVINCLQGIEVAKDLGWVDLRTFNVAEWHLLREKFDASWLVPGDILALADPSITAQNPRFPGLLQPVEDAPLKWQPRTGFVMSMADFTSDDATTCSPTSMSSDELRRSFQGQERVEDLILDLDEDLEPVARVPSALKPRLPSSPRDHDEKQKSLATSGSQSLPANLAGLAVQGERRLSASSKAQWQRQHTSEQETAERNLSGGFASYFERSGIGQLVRLNFSSECAEQRPYTQAFDESICRTIACEFPDGTAPPKGTVATFIESCQQHQTWAVQNSGRPCIAVHCKGGLGRTGSIIAAYACSRYAISGEAFHGFARLMRPGVIQTPEQEKFVRGLSGDAQPRTSRFGSRFPPRKLSELAPSTSSRDSSTSNKSGSISGSFSPKNIGNLLSGFGRSSAKRTAL